MKSPQSRPTPPVFYAGDRPYTLHLLDDELRDGDGDLLCGAAVPSAAELWISGHLSPAERQRTFLYILHRANELEGGAPTSAVERADLTVAMYERLQRDLAQRDLDRDVLSTLQAEPWPHGEESPAEPRMLFQATEGRPMPLSPLLTGPGDGRTVLTLDQAAERFEVPPAALAADWRASFPAVDSRRRCG